ncbi:sodium:calcium antiporter [Nocardiopsis baichengensis]|uniref:sodium:calcium antiporter n=1 Tax=Nocardiopsis baichengensis TaxID=280240 RepID=UPI000348D510|nr:hypothetical protein [Nocardiopsis baichengensis]
MGAWPLWASAAVLIGAAVLLTVGGGPFTRLVDRLADRTGIGETIAGIVMVGAVTSLPGLLTSIVAASAGDTELAMGNALGGIAVQTAFLALADLYYRRSNLEHAAASLQNLLAPVVLAVMLGVVLMAGAGPQVTVAGVHIASPVLVGCYLYWLHLSREVRDRPLWRVVHTKSTRPDLPEEGPSDTSERLSVMWVKFVLLAAVVAGTGYAVGGAGLSVAAQTGLSSGVVGAVVTGVVTSLPELVTVLFAVRIRALHLAIGDIVGGNGFDVLFLSAADVAYRDGSLYAAMGPRVVLLIGLAIVLNLLVAAGLIRRDESGIGFEGVAILLVYAVGVVSLAALG